MAAAGVGAGVCSAIPGACALCARCNIHLAMDAKESGAAVRCAVASSRSRTPRCFCTPHGRVPALPQPPRGIKHGCFACPARVLSACQGVIAVSVLPPLAKPRAFMRRFHWPNVSSARYRSPRYDRYQMRRAGGGLASSTRSTRQVNFAAAIPGVCGEISSLLNQTLGS